MLRFKDGDEAAFEEIVRRNVNNVHALIYRFLRDPSIVDDVTQDVFLRIYRNAARYEAINRPLTRDEYRQALAIAEEEGLRRLDRR